MKSKTDYIAVFDSGVGGVSVLRHLHRRMPGERYIYFGDCANAPYGSRTTEDVRRLSLAAAKYLADNYPIKALVVACNTATAAAIGVLRAEYPDLIVVGIEPALKLAADKYPGGRIGVMATQVTLREEKFDLLLHRFPDCTVEKIPAPGLVELIEKGMADSPEAENLLHKLLDPYKNQLDALVLGCTHYPFAASTIQKVLGSSVELLDGGDGTAMQTQRRLREADLLSTETSGEILIKSSLDSQELHRLAQQYFRF